ncbi:putative protein TPRXL [Chelmon rostratus]|uniref:putative protein TPRXL n=1 Tax=Chelmon rostratus TaxID=109905 RepID=UPI001BE85D25|nr:putative protein TPRXL [Chelmon rostratus]XP_041821533.1 putative protein TPRXL [Chelmon rostratus]
MKSSPSSSSTSAMPEKQILCSSSCPPPLPRLSLQSPELQAEFLQERLNKFQPHRDVSESSVVSSPSSSSSSPLPSPFSPTPIPSSSSSPSSPCHDSRPARLSLSSPELLSELKASRTRSLRHVPAHNGLTTVFSGRGGGGQASGPASSRRPANQRTSH